MTLTLHSLSVYEEIVAHASLNMMTKITDCVGASDPSYYIGAKNKSEAFRKAWIGATEATLIERKERKLLPSEFD